MLQTSPTYSLNNFGKVSKIEEIMTLGRSGQEHGFDVFIENQQSVD
jgi:hypothetical protein